MREMKDSSVEWIGEIPKDWDVCCLKYLLKNNDGGVWGNDPKNDDYDKIVLRSTEQTVDGKWDIQSPAIRNLKNVSSNYSIKPNDLLITKSSGSSLHIGKSTLADAYFSKKECYYSNFLQRLRTNEKLNAKFLWYLLNNDIVRQQFILMQNSTIGIGNINAEDINRVVVAYPDATKQQRIADFLDEKCGEIDSLTKDIQEQIATLEEYKKSIVTETVTKGLDLNVDMKDSGIEWVGTIPKHWIVEKIKYHLQRKEPRNPGDVQVLSVYREYGVIPKDSRDDNHNVTSEDTSKYKYVKPGNLVINKMKAWQGSLAISEYEGIVSPAYFIYHFIDDVFNKKYFHYLIRSCYKDEFRRISTGIREGQWDLPSRDFENELVLIPPKNEQNDIVNYLDSKCSEIDAIIQTKKEQLDVLAEYKKSLIYEYVTGKKEVPVNE